MLMRICLVLAIIAGLGVGGLNFVKVKEKITTLQNDLDQTKKTLADTQGKLSETTKKLDSTTKELTQTKATLETTTAEKEAAVATATSAKKQVEKLTEDLGKTTIERDDAKGKLAAYEGTGFTPPQILAFGKQIKGLEDDVASEKAANEALLRVRKRLENRLAKYEEPEKPVLLPANLTGKVLVSDPKWNFVVLSVGENQGVLEDGELLVNRNGRLVAKVKVSSVQKDRCVANVMNGWQLSDVVEGDMVIPAHPSS